MKKRIIDTKVWKTGNSYVVTIPRRLIEKLNLKVGDELEVAINVA